MNKTNIVSIVSPSGNLYGSENVLLTFLEFSTHHYEVWVPSNSLLFQRLKPLGHRVRFFSGLPWLYAQLLLRSFLRKLTLYVNEGGHIRYLNVLRFFNPGIRVINHIRLVADVKRLQGTNLNIHHIAVSKFILNKVDSGHVKHLIYDPVNITIKETVAAKTGIPHYGIIGRVTPTKGLAKALQLFEFFEELKHNCHIHFFGVVEEEKTEVLSFKRSCAKLKQVQITFHGFEGDKGKIYNGLNAVLHFNSEESFGLVLPESWLHGVPLIAFNDGGLGELAALCGVADYLVEEKDGWTEAMCQILLRVNNFNSQPPHLHEIQNQIQELFSPKSYVSVLEELLLK